MIIIARSNLNMVLDWFQNIWEIKGVYTIGPNPEDRINKNQRTELLWPEDQTRGPKKWRSVISTQFIYLVLRIRSTVPAHSNSGNLTQKSDCKFLKIEVAWERLRDAIAHKSQNCRRRPFLSLKFYEFDPKTQFGGLDLALRPSRLIRVFFHFQGTKDMWKEKAG